MKPFSFLHAADLHLDSPFRGLSVDDEKISSTIRASTFEAFDTLVRLAIERRVDFVVIAGDVYDADDRSLRAQLRFHDGMCELGRHGIRSFVAHGNHDPLDSAVSNLRWPDEVHVFGGSHVETVSVHRDGEPVAFVSGISFPKRNERRNLAERFKRSPAAPFHVGVLHCNVGGNTGHDPYAPCELADLLATSLDYWALGHVHTRQTLHERPHVIYPGNTQGRHVREAGARGAVVVDVDAGGEITVEFVPLDAVRWVELVIPIDGIDAVDVFDDRLQGTVDDAVSTTGGRPLICRVAVNGRGPLQRDLARESAAQQMLERIRERYAGRNPFVWVQALTIDCRPEIDLDERSRADDLLAQVLRGADLVRESPDSLADLYTRALSRLYENSRAVKALGGPPSDEEMIRLIDEAVGLCIERLEHGA